MAPIDSSTPLPRHRISQGQLDALGSGEQDDATLAVLRNAEHSRHLLALRLLLHLAREHPDPTGPLPPVDDAWRLLVRAQGEDADVIAELLGHPQIGVWTAHTLRRLRGTASDPAPLWFHIGQLHAVASAAAIRIGLSFRLAIPLWNGVAVLPSVGSAHLSANAEWTSGSAILDAGGARIEGDDETVEIGLDSQSWRPVRIYRAHANNVSLALHLDDVGPYRGLDIPTPPDPLSTESAARWSALLDEAWPLLARDHRHRARELAAGLVAVAPRPAAFRFRPHSASVGDGFGAAIISESHDAAQLAVTLAHEFQHSTLNGIEHLVPLQRDDPSTDCYAPWRDDPRPTGGLLQGVYAFTAVTEFWGVHRERVAGAERALAEFEFALWRLQTDTALTVLRARRSLTDTGRRFVDRIAARMAVWETAEVPEDALRAALLSAADHRAGWRVSHLRRNQTEVRDAGHAWLSGAPAPKFRTESTVVPNKNPYRLDVKAVLARILIADPAEFDAARAAQGHRSAGEADFALVRGNPAEARELYLSELTRPCDRPGAWAGLGLALAAVAPGPAATALRTRPELVQAVHREVAEATGEAPHPEELAGWL